MNLKRLSVMDCLGIVIAVLLLPILAALTLLMLPIFALSDLNQEYKKNTDGGL